MKVQKLRVRIINVDPSTRLIQGKDATGLLTISVFEVLPGFTWPQEGEYWSVYKENQAWLLGGRIQGPNDTRVIENLLPGQSLAPINYEERISTGTTQKIIDHSLGSKALKVTVRPSFVGYKCLLATDITPSTSAFAVQESLPDGGLRPSGSAFLRLGDEIISYSSNTTSPTVGSFSGLTRGRLGTTPVVHLAGREVTLFSYPGGVVAPSYTIMPIDNDLSIIVFSSPTAFSLDISIIA